jgi:hypothetical protein
MQSIQRNSRMQCEMPNPESPAKVGDSSQRLNKAMQTTQGIGDMDVERPALQGVLQCKYWAILFRSSKTKRMVETRRYRICPWK